ncbi:MAG: type I restriction-modification system subunit M N-terminal domain-containing protein [Lactobacillaceae bacterium]|jgi:type I restriction enzyme M protein|nr:type I restriction-modification system subunit M N-terminal domain-containing protein [Lactobacillaceae bacterium]
MALTPEKEALIWKTLNSTRGKIEPSEYKNYIFGVMFYKFLSEKALAWLDSKLTGGRLGSNFGLKIQLKQLII